MVTTNELYDLVRDAWSQVPAPPRDDLGMMEWKWGKSAALAFTGVAPVDVDTGSPGFHAATPLMDLPPRAAAAYLGTYLLSLLQSLMFQESVGLFDDIVTRPHTLTCLTNEGFWERVIRRHLPKQCQQAVEEVARHLAEKQQALQLSQEQVQALLEVANMAQ
jgi:hypothetical protein